LGQSAGRSSADRSTGDTILPIGKEGKMADPIAYHIVAKDDKGNLAYEGYVKPDSARLIAKSLKEELFTVSVDAVDSLPEGVDLA
jgi:hypothetical protein